MRTLYKMLSWWAMFRSLFRGGIKGLIKNRLRAGAIKRLIYFMKKHGV